MKKWEYLDLVTHGFLYWKFPAILIMCKFKTTGLHCLILFLFSVPEKLWKITKSSSHNHFSNRKAPSRSPVTSFDLPPTMYHCSLGCLDKICLWRSCHFHACVNSNWTYNKVPSPSVQCYVKVRSGVSWSSSVSLDWQFKVFVKLAHD